MARKGFFVSLEGPDGAGKSDATRYMVKELRGLGHEVISTREPGGTPLAEIIRELALGIGAHADAVEGEGMTSKCETLLMFAAREQHLEKVIRPALRRGAIVISDRFLDSTYMYQVAGGKVSEQFVDMLADAIVEMTHPDLTLVMMVDPAVGLMRKRQNQPLDINRLDLKGDDYAKRAQEMLVARAHRFSQEAPITREYELIDANRSILEVQDTLMGIARNIHSTVKLRNQGVLDQ